MRKNISIYTDGSQKTDIKHTSFSGYLLVDEDVETVHIRPISDEYTIEKTKSFYKVNGSCSAEVIAYINALKKCLSYTNTDFNIYTDFLDILNILESKKKKTSQLKSIYIELINKNKELGNNI